MFESTSTGKKDTAGEADKKRYELMITVTAFLGGLTTAAMVVVMQSRDKFALSLLSASPIDYGQILIGIMAGTSFLFVLASFGCLNVVSLKSAESVKSTSAVDKVVMSGYFAIMALFPLLVLPFSWIVAIIIFALELVVFLYMIDRQY